MCSDLLWFKLFLLCYAVIQGSPTPNASNGVPYPADSDLMSGEPRCHGPSLTSWGLEGRFDLQGINKVPLCLLALPSNEPLGLHARCPRPPENSLQKCTLVLSPLVHGSGHLKLGISSQRLDI